MRIRTPLVQHRFTRPRGVALQARLQAAADKVGVLARVSLRCYIVTLKLPFMPVAKWISHW